MGMIEDIEGSKNLTPEEKRVLKIAELNAIQDAFLQNYFAECKEKAISPDLVGLMQNGMGMGAGDLYTDAELDALIAADEAEVNKGADAPKGE
jgi:hypothetical protein